LNFNLKVMRTIISVSLLVAAAFISEQSYASGGFRVNLLTGTEKKNLLEISDNADKKYEISVYDASGEVIFNQKTLGEQQNFNRIYDLSKLDYGVYKVEVQTDGESNEQFVTIGKKGIEVGKTTKKIEPFFSFKDNKLVLSYLNFSGDKISLNLYDSNGLVWSKEIGKDYNLQKVFDLSKLENGDFKVVLDSDDQSYEYDLTKK